MAQRIFSQFLEGWLEQYNEVLTRLHLFNKTKHIKWDIVTKQKFVKCFYHARGQFYHFLWYLGNYAEDYRIKKMVTFNIEEEFGYTKKSHEQLYMDFAESFGVDLSTEHIDLKYYHKDIQEFNKGHMRWLVNHDNDERLAAFSAYEKLDNIDYPRLRALANNIGTTEKGLLFFKVHEQVEHFESTEEYLQDIWDKSPDKIIKAFEFIAEHQLQMWQDLYRLISC